MQAFEVQISFDDMEFNKEWSYGPWVKTFRFDPEVLALMDRHYSRQTIGSPHGISEWGYENMPPTEINTYVDQEKVKSRNPGYSYKRAGFTEIGKSKKRINFVEVEFN